MKIGFFTDTYFPRKDGAAYAVKTWKEKLEDRGHEVHVVYPKSKDYEPEKNEHPIWSVKDPFYLGHRAPLPFRKKNMPDVDIYHVHSPWFIGIEALWKAKRENKPSVFTLHTPLEFFIKETDFNRFTKKMLDGIYLNGENFLLKKFDAVTVNSDRVERSVRTEFIPVGIDTEFFRKEEFEPEFEYERPVIGRSGRLSEEKNIDELVEFAERFDGTVVIVGEGRAKDSLEENAPENVVFRDFLERERLPGFLSWLDVFVTCSTHDTLNLTHLEASSCGTPVVAPNMIPFQDTITEDNGLLYESGNLDDLEEKVANALEKDFYPRKRAQDYSIIKSVKKLEQLYSDLDAER